MKPTMKMIVSWVASVTVGVEGTEKEKAPVPPSPDKCQFDNIKALTLGFVFHYNSGLAVMPNTDEPPAPGAARDHVFGMASNAQGDEAGQIRRTITMVGIII